MSDRGDRSVSTYDHTMAVSQPPPILGGIWSRVMVLILGYHGSAQYAFVVVRIGARHGMKLDAQGGAARRVHLSAIQAKVSALPNERGRPMVFCLQHAS